MKHYLVAALCIATSPLFAAQPSINDMQTCQAVLDFVVEKLDPAPVGYSAEDVAKVKSGLNGYNQYIQQTIIKPGLLAYTSGDVDKAVAFQIQIDAYKANVVGKLNSRYPQHRLFADHAVAVNECAKKSVPAGEALDSLKLALETMLKLAKQH